MKNLLSHAVALVALSSLGGSLGACSDGGSEGDGDASGGSTGSGGAGTGGDVLETGGSTGAVDGSGGAQTGGTGTVFGSPCTSDADCPAVAGFSPFCQTSWPGGYCTSGCAAIGPCGEAGSVCQVSLAECRKGCTEETEATDCRVAEGYSCVVRDGIAGCEN